jgi:CheY-like chemotaxis protein
MNNPGSCEGKTPGFTKGSLGAVCLAIVAAYAFAGFAISLANPLRGAVWFAFIFSLVFFPPLLLAWFALRVRRNDSSPAGNRDDLEFFIITTSLGAACARRSGDSTLNIDHVAGTICTMKPRPSALSKTGTRRVLWVDDNSAGIAYERRALEAFGLEVVLASSTEKAMAWLEKYHFDIVISDRQHALEPQAGHRLLRRIRNEKNANKDVPFYLYDPIVSDRDKQQVQEGGGQGCATDPLDLYLMVTKEVLASKP